MGELRDRMDDEARRVSSSAGGLEEVKRRAGRRRIRRQVTTGVVALALAGGSFALAFAAFRGPDTVRPVAGPSPSAISAVRVRLLDGANNPEAIEIARGLISSGGFEVVEEGPAGHSYRTTTIACPSEFDDEAATIARRLDVDASIVGAIPHPEYDLTVHIGEDFATFEHERLLAWIESFVEARRGGDAERFLAPSARDDYFETSGRAEPGSGELYLYPTEGIARHRVFKWDKLDATTWRFELRLAPSDRCAGALTERIWIEVLGEDRYRLAAAELVRRMPAPLCPP